MGADKSVTMTLQREEQKMGYRDNYEGLLEENFDDLYEEYDEDLYEEYEEEDDDMDESMYEELDEMEDEMEEMEESLREAYATIDQLQLEAQEKDDMLFRAGTSIALLRAANRLGEDKYLHRMSELPHISEFTDVMQFNEWIEGYALEVFNEDFNAHGEQIQESYNYGRQPHNMLTESHIPTHQPQPGNPLGRHGQSILANFNGMMSNNGF